MQATTLMNFPKLPEMGPEFHRTVAEIADRLGMDPDMIDAVMYSESGFDPHIVNPRGGASGLIQVMPAYAADGSSPIYKYTIAEIRAMDAVTQLREIVEPAFRPWVGKLNQPVDYFLKNFFPRAVGKDDNYPMGVEGSTEPISVGSKVTYGDVYKNNTPRGRRGPLDYNMDGVIDVADMKTHTSTVLARAANRPPITVYPPGMEPAPATTEAPPASVEAKPSSGVFGAAMAGVSAAVAYMTARVLGKKNR